MGAIATRYQGVSFMLGISARTSDPIGLPTM
jgi:hypothetical protein